jgi:hypothetical protein
MQGFSYKKQLQSAQQEMMAISNHFQKLEEIMKSLIDHAPNKRVIAPERPMSKSEVASILCMSSRSFSNLIKEFESDLSSMGVKKTAKKLPPEAVRFLCEKVENYEDLD